MLASRGSDIQLRVYTVVAGQLNPDADPVQDGTDIAALAAQNPLGADKVHLWLIPASDTRVTAARRWISAHELARADSIRTADARRQFIVARGFLRLLLAHYLGVEARRIGFGLGRNGKPYLALPTGSPVTFNVSHTEQAVAIGFAMDADIGVDIERVRADFAWHDVADLVFSPVECRALARADSNAAPRDFFGRWVRMEAALKLRGDGILQAVQQKRAATGQPPATDWPGLQVGFEFGPDVIGSLAARPWQSAALDRSP